MTPLQQLLSELVDYAGLFPPAGLDMQTMAANYAHYLQSNHSWMLGRVVVPLAKVSEFAETYSGPAVRISALPPALDSEEFPDAARAIASFNSESDHTIDAVEVRTADVDAISMVKELPPDVRCFIETPLDVADTFVGAIAEQEMPERVFAKVRTGGVKPNMIPDASDVAAFIVECHRGGVGFKATAGLHHPCRAVFPLTYEPNAESARMHGFLNVFLTACFVKRFDLSVEHAATCLDELQANELVANSETISWRDYSIDSDAIANTRANFATSFGSCSFTEPVDDLTSLSLLPENPNATY